ncbi:MAG: efflux RND transporter periplasmic adaptor subunit [Candidatus Rokuibacteriota bacterium]
MTARRTGLSALALALLATLPVTGCSRSEAEKPPVKAVAAPPIAVETVVSEARALPGSLDVTGTLMADAQTDVASETEARVTRVLIERGQVVAAGAMLVQLDPQDATNQLREAEATEAQTMAKLGITPEQAFDPGQTPEVRQARVTLERMELEFQRYDRLVKEGAVSRSEYDLKRNDHLAQKEQYEARVNEARQLYQTLQAQRARVAMARKTLGDTIIRAPYAGLIVEKLVNVGQWVPKGGKVATLVRVDPLRVELAIPEAAVSAVRQGQKVSFSVQMYPDRAFAGAVAYVGPALKSDSRALVVEALVPNPSGALRPGLFATAHIELPAGAPLPLVPANAIRTEAGVSRLFVVASGRAELRFVQLGRNVGTQVEILRGLKAGEPVVKDIPTGLTDGAPVTDRTATGGR